MKRYGFLFEKVCCYETLMEAAENARKGKMKQENIRLFCSDLENNIRLLLRELETGTYVTSEYSTFVIKEPKRREIYRLPFRDRVVQWAIMLVLRPIWNSYFTKDTYSCIKGRGIHTAYKRLKKELAEDPEGTRYCLKLDINKFYPSIDHDILKVIMRKKIKDEKLLFLLDGIIDSVSENDGVPIGNYLSQYFANLYLAELDHLLKEVCKVKYYYRYSDDLILLSDSKEKLSSYLVFINHYLHEERKMSIKKNFQIFPVDDRGIDFLGYRTYHSHSLMRKRNKKNLCREVAKLQKKGFTEEEIRLKTASRAGYGVHCNSKFLFKTLNIKTRMEIKRYNRDQYESVEGTKINVEQMMDKHIILLKWREEGSQFGGEAGFRLKLFFMMQEMVEQEDGTKKLEWVRHINFNASDRLRKNLRKIPEEDFPMLCKFTKERITKGGKNGHYYVLDNPDEDFDPGTIPDG